jgi:hypothetical protein
LAKHQIAERHAVAFKLWIERPAGRRVQIHRIVP